MEYSLQRTWVEKWRKRDVPAECQDTIRLRAAFSEPALLHLPHVVFQQSICDGRTEERLGLSNDPVMMDALARDRINANRRKQGFEPVDEEIRTLEFAETLGVGSTKTKHAKIIRVD